MLYKMDENFLTTKFIFNPKWLKTHSRSKNAKKQRKSKKLQKNFEIDSELLITDFKTNL